MLKKYMILLVLQYVGLYATYFMIEHIDGMFSDILHEMNYRVDSQIIISKEYTDPLQDYLKCYDYSTLNEEKVLINGEKTNYQIDVIPYYPEQYAFDENTIYLSKQFQYIHQIHSIAIEETEYEKFIYLEEDTSKIKGLTILVPYTHFKEAKYHCYFVNIFEISTEALYQLDLEEMSTISLIEQNKSVLDEQYRNTVLLKSIVMIFFIGIFCFMSYEMILTIDDLLLALRLFGYSKISILLGKQGIFTVFMVLIFCFQPSTLLLFLFIIASVIQGIVDYVVWYRKSIADIIRYSSKISG